MSFLFKSLFYGPVENCSFKRSYSSHSDSRHGEITWESILLDERCENGQLFSASKSAFFPRNKIGLSKQLKTLVLDLDETLVHSTSRNVGNYNHTIQVMVEGQVCIYYVYKRPHLDAFLDQVGKWFNVCIFTASLAEYADPLVDWLDRGRNIFKSRHFRQSCIETSGSYTKDLSIISKDLSSVILLDNSPISYLINPSNALPITGWIDDPLDQCLLDILPFLDALRFVDDVRSILSLRML